MCNNGEGITETINAGCIPVIIIDKMKSLPFQQYLDYSKFSIIINIKDIDKLISILKSITYETKEKLFKELKNINDNYFISLEK